MSRYDGLIIPRSYSEYINKTDAATLLQALQQSGVMDAVPTANSNHPAKSGGIYTALNTPVATTQNVITASPNIAITSQNTQVFRIGTMKIIHSRIEFGEAGTSQALFIDITNIAYTSFSICNWYSQNVGSGIGMMDNVNPGTTKIWIKGGIYNAAKEWNIADFANKTLFVDIIVM